MADSRYDIDRKKLPDPSICAKCGWGIAWHFLHPDGCPFELRKE